MSIFLAKHDPLAQCWFNIGPPSATLDQHSTSIGPVSRVFFPPSRKHSINIVGSMLGHRLRRWPNIKPTTYFVYCVVITDGHNADHL